MPIMPCLLPARLLVLMLALLPGDLLADELRIALFDVAPYSYRDASAKPQGLYVDLSLQLAALTKRNARFELTSFARRGWLIMQGQADMTIGFETAELKHGAIRLGPVAWVDSIILLRPGLVTEDIRGLRLGRIRGGCTDLQTRHPQQQFTDINHYQSGLNMLLHSRLDGLCGTEDALDYSAKLENLDIKGLHRMPVTRSREVWVFVSAHTRPDLQQVLTWAVDRLNSQTARNETQFKSRP